MPVDIIRKAAEEHEECMKSIDDAKNRSQVKHIGIGKTSERIDKIPSVMSAFNRITPSTSKGHKALPFLKERGHQEAIAMAVKFQNPRRSEQTNEVVIQEDASSSKSMMTFKVEEKIAKDVKLWPNIDIEIPEMEWTLPVLTVKLCELQLKDELCQKKVRQVNTNTDTSRSYYIDRDGVLRKILYIYIYIYNLFMYITLQTL